MPAERRIIILVWLAVGAAWACVTLPWAVGGMDPLSGPTKYCWRAAAAQALATVAVAATGRWGRPWETPVTDVSWTLLGTTCVTLAAPALGILMGAGLFDAKAAEASSALACFLCLASAAPALAALRPSLRTLAASAAGFRCSARDGAAEWAAVVPCVGAAWGCLLASPAVLLDWGEAWQRWPLPGMAGGMAGLTVAACVVTWQLAGRRGPSKAD